MIDKLIKECEEIQSFLEITMSDDSVEVIGRGCDLASYMARTGKMLADAKKIYNGKKKVWQHGHERFCAWLWRR